MNVRFSHEEQFSSEIPDVVYDFSQIMRIPFVGERIRNEYGTFNVSSIGTDLVEGEIIIIYER